MSDNLVFTCSFRIKCEVLRFNTNEISTKTLRAFHQFFMVFS